MSATTTDFPHITGFDMPSASAASEQDAVLVAVLDAHPSLAWQQTFARQAAAFAVERRLTFVRLVGKHINLVGQVRQLRQLAPAVQSLVSIVTRACAQGASNAPVGVHQALAEVARNTPSLPLDTGDVRSWEVAMIEGMPRTPALLREVSQITGLRFTAIARVTETRWTACAVHDELDFGLLPGQDLILETTICNELRVDRQTINFNSASAHARFSRHHTPATYGFEAYISTPIVLADGSLFGTLCGVDTEPKALEPDMVARVERLAAEVAAALNQFLPPQARAS